MIRSSSIHAAGCYTTSPIAKGVQVVEYTGPRISKKEADKRFEDSKITYLFGIGDGSTVINGMGVAMYINHSCDPNCETEEVDGRVWIMSCAASRRAKSSPTTTTCTTATRTMRAATAEPATAARRCIRRKRLRGGRKQPGEKPSGRQRPGSVKAGHAEAG